MRRLLTCLVLPLLAQPGIAQELRHEWSFADGLGDWFAAHGATVEHADGAMVIQITGGDPYLHASKGQALDLEGSARQFIRIQMQTEVEGGASFYWADTTKGPDAGFIADQVIGFAADPDGEWHDYDVYPNWTGRITRLRLDPPGNEAGGVVKVAGIAIYEWPTSTQHGPRWDLGGDHANWLPVGGTRAEVTPQGLVLSGPTPRVGTMLDAPAADGKWLTIEANSSGAGRLQAAWRNGTSDWVRAESQLRPGPARYVFDLTAGGRPPLAGATLQLIAYYHEPGELRLETIGLAATPLGSPQLEILDAGFDRAVALPGESVALSLTVRNIGERTLPATPIVVKGLPKPLTCPELAPGEARVLPQSLKFEQPGERQVLLNPDGAATALSLRVSGPLPSAPPGGPSVSEAGVALVGESVRLRGGYIVDERVLDLCLEVKDADGWRRVGTLPALGEVVSNQTVDCAGTARVEGDELVLRNDAPVLSEARYRLLGDGRIAVRQTFKAAEAAEVKRLDGPWLRAGDGAAGAAKWEALLPGMEYLGSDLGYAEPSSSDRDVAQPGALRVVPHRNNLTIPMAAVSFENHDLVALLWQNGADGNGPAAAFASPNFAEGTDAGTFGLTRRSGNNHLLAIFWPPVPEQTAEDTFVATEPVTLAAGESVTLEAVLLARPQSDVLDAVDAWIDLYDPAPAGRVTDLLPTTLQLIRHAFEQVLWQPDRNGWYSIPTRQNMARGPSMAVLYRYLAHDLSDPSLLAKAKERVPRTTWLPLALHQGNLGAALRELQAGSRNGLAGRQDDGHWTFQPDEKRADLGRRGDTNVGIEASPIIALLLGARAASDEDLLQTALEALENLKAYRVPRGAQVWEVPLHCPDILASGRACEAYCLAFELTGKPAYLREAEYWAHTALPFIYQWQQPEAAWAPMRGGSIPVFGASGFRNEWFGRLVQWNGVVVAEALDHLARLGGDPRYGAVAENLTVSAQRQLWPDPESDHCGLYPDYWNMRTGIPDFWLSSERVLTMVLKRLGETPEGDWRTFRLDDHLVSTVTPMPLGTVRVIVGGRTQAVPLAGGSYRGPVDLELEVGYSLDEAASLAVIGVAEPTGVLVDGQPLARSETEPTEPGWQYLPDCAAVNLRLDFSALKRHTVRLTGLKPAEPSTGGQRQWAFKGTALGWGSPANEVEVQSTETALKVTGTGGDPYFAGPPLKVPANAIKAVEINVRVSGPGGFQLFYAVNGAGFDAEQTVSASAPPADGKFHTVRFNVADSAGWTGLVTRLRFDPPGGAGAVTEFSWVKLLE